MKKLEKKIFVLGGVCLAFVVMITTLFLNSYSIQETVKSISITSTKLDYSNKEAGSFKVTKSSEWISSEKVKITMDLDTVSFPNEGEKNLILILDTSNVMDGKINSIKDSMNVLIDTFLVNSNYKMALIDMNEESTILSNLTNNKEKITSKIDGISLRGESRNYYQALKSVETILNKREEETTVIFLTGGYSNKETPNEKVEYGYLKEQYQNLTIYGLSYEMGDSKIVESISDKGYLVTSDNLTKTLLSISNFSKKYQELTIKDIVNEHNFDISTITNMKVTEGITTVSGKEINWNLEDFRSGNDASLSFEVSLKEERKEEVGNIETNEEEEIKYEIEGTSETIRSNKTPILGTTYEVIYEGNAPRGCTVENVPVVENHKVYEKVEVSKEVPVCKGYTFQGWRHVTKGVEQISEDTFQMPGSDVILRATWSSFSIAMSLEGEVIEYKKPILQSVGENYTGEIWGYKENIKKIVIQDYMKEIPNAIEVFDISKEKNGGLLAYIVEENGGYTVYIQGDGRIELSPDSSNLFNGFTNLEVIEGLENLDTSKVENMSNMFKGCSSLTNLDVSHFDTSNVTNMSGMFEGCTNITELDVSNFDTSKVTDMNNMFKDCNSLTNLDVSGFNTSNVTDMSGMFQGCTNLESVDLTGIDTSKIKDMSHMFDGCGNLTTITPENIEVPEGTKTDGLFNGCENLPTRPIKVSYSVEITTNEGGRVSTNLLSIDYGSSNTFEVIPNTGYYLSSISCINGYTTNANVGTSQTETQTITISNNNQDSISTCTVEFDTTFVTYLVSLAKTDTTNLAYDTTSDRNLRYIGTSPNNYVRFNNELWRVIGVMNNVADSNGSKASRIKLIRASSIGNLNWHNTVDVVNWPGSSTGILLNSGTYWNRSGSYSSIGLTSDTKTKISAITWNLGGAKNLAECTFTSAEMYMAERGTLVNVGSTTWKGYVGLMYGSDYGYAVGGSARNTCLSAKLGSYSSCYTSNWLYLGSQELIMTANSIAAPYSFLILKGSLNAMGTAYHKYVGATRPVVYLNTNIKRTGGSGTSSDPFTIE